MTLERAERLRAAFKTRKDHSCLHQALDLLIDLGAANTYACGRCGSLLRLQEVL